MKIQQKIFVSTFYFSHRISS